MMNGVLQPAGTSHRCLLRTLVDAAPGVTPRTPPADTPPPLGRNLTLGWGRPPSRGWDPLSSLERLSSPPALGPVPPAGECSKRNDGPMPCQGLLHKILWWSATPSQDTELQGTYAVDSSVEKMCDRRTPAMRGPVFTSSAAKPRHVEPGKIRPAPQALEGQSYPVLLAVDTIPSPSILALTRATMPRMLR
jgi:hypothetical protein